MLFGRWQWSTTKMFCWWEEAAKLSSGVVLMAAEVYDGGIVWEAAIVSNCDVFLAAEVDGISGGGVVWRATNIISNIVVWAVEGGGGISIWRAAHINANVIMRSGNERWRHHLLTV